MPPSPKKEAELRQRMQRMGIRESDLREHFVRSSGAGGQNVNKVSTCVVLSHGPSGIEVKCQETRQQALNRYYARVRLCEKLETRVLGRESEASRRRWKVRKQKQRRSKKAREKMLEGKKKLSEKKRLRAPVKNEG